MSQIISFLRPAAKMGYDNSSSALTATNVQAAIDELDSSLDGALVDITNLQTLSGRPDGSTDLATFTGSTIPDASTIKAALQAIETAYEETDANVDDLVTLTGVAENATDLGTFTGSTIPDNVAVKPALQSLETSLETKAADADVIKKDGSVAFTGAQSMGNFKLTDVADPTAATDAANKQYVDSVSAGLDPKESVKVATTGSNIDLATGGLLTIDGETLSAGDRVLVKDQTDPKENGIYDVVAGTWVRSSDFDGSPTAEVSGGAHTFVEAGPINGQQGFVLLGVGEQALGVDNILWTQFTGASSIVAGDALSQTGNQLDVNVDNSTVEVNADALRVKADGINDTHIDFGTGANQVSAVDLPIADSGSLITATEVEGALQELAGATDAIEDNTITSPNGSVSVAGTIGGDNQTVDVVFSTTGTANRSIEASSLASTSASEGASMIGISDVGTLITATDVEGALAENRTAIDAVEDNTITSPNGSLSTSGTVGGDNQQLDVVFSTTGAANRSIEASSLASTSASEGASMVGISDVAGNFTATDVEGALTEVDGRLDALEAGGTLDWVVKTAAYTAADGDKLLADTATTGAFTITLPLSPAVGDEVVIRDAVRNSETAAITVGRNGENIGALAEDLTVDINGIQVHLVYVNATHGWSVEAS